MDFFGARRGFRRTLSRAIIPDLSASTRAFCFAENSRAARRPHLGRIRFTEYHDRLFHDSAPLSFRKPASSVVHWLYEPKNFFFRSFGKLRLAKSAERGYFKGNSRSRRPFLRFGRLLRL